MLPLTRATHFGIPVFEFATAKYENNDFATLKKLPCTESGPKIPSPHMPAGGLGHQTSRPTLTRDHRVMSKHGTPNLLVALGSSTGSDPESRTPRLTKRRPQKAPSEEVEARPSASWDLQAGRSPHGW